GHAMKQILVSFLFITTVFFMPVSIWAQTDALPHGDFAELRQTGPAKITGIIAPQTLQLEDGSIIALAGLDFPDLDPRDPGELAIAATKILREMLEGQEVILYQTQNSDKGRMNRLGHEIAHLARKSDQAWTQGTLIVLGLARVM